MWLVPAFIMQLITLLIPAAHHAPHPGCIARRVVWSVVIRISSRLHSLQGGMEGGMDGTERAIKRYPEGASGIVGECLA